MRFGETPVEAARGHILAHSLRVGDGVLKKGRVLDGTDLERLAASGYRQVVTDAGSRANAEHGADRREATRCAWIKMVMAASVGRKRQNR